MRMIQILTGIIVSGIIWCSHVNAREVIATGAAAIYNGNIGSAKNQAILNAQRQAVEQGVGTFIDSNTISQNFEVIKDEILSTSRGYVTRYDIVKEGNSADGASYEVTIKADVADDKIKDKLTTLRLLHKKMGNQRVMIIYTKRDPNAVERTNGAVQTTLGVIRDEFNRMGFRVFNESQMENVYQAIEKAAIVDRPVDSLIAMALDQHAEIMVQFEMVAGKRDKEGGMFYATKATLRLGVYDASTGRQIADVVTEGKELSASQPGPYDWYNMLGKIGQRSGLKAAEDAISRIMSYYAGVGDQGFAYLIVFRNYSTNQEDQILDYLENTPGFKQLTELKNSPGYLEIELFSADEKSRLRRKIRKDLQQKNIQLEAQEVSGNRLIFMNASSAPGGSSGSSASENSLDLE